MCLLLRHQFLQNQAALLTVEHCRRQRRRARRRNPYFWKLPRTNQAKREVVHEAEVLTALVDHEGLPMLVGVKTANEPFCLVTQFHGIIEQSVTLHQAVNNKIITSAECIHSFICKDLLRLRAPAFKRFLAQRHQEQQCGP